MSAAATVLASLQAQKQGLALALGHDVPEFSGGHPRTLGLPGRERAPATVLEALCMPGTVVELSALPGAGALTLALLLLAEAGRSGARFLCAVDPTRTLHAPAVGALLAGRGVALDRLLVLQPDVDRLLRTAVRALRSGAFAGLVVDAGTLDSVGHAGFVTGVRRLALAAEESRALAVLLTSTRAARGLPLPTAARALVENDEVRFLRHRQGALPRMAVARP